MLAICANGLNLVLASRCSLLPRFTSKHIRSIDPPAARQRGSPSTPPSHCPLLATESTSHFTLAASLELRPCEHQVAGHLFEDGKAGSLVDGRGHFYKPLQRGPRGNRERAFYDAVAATLQAEAAAGVQHAAVAGRRWCPSFAVSNGTAMTAAAAAAAACSAGGSPEASSGLDSAGASPHAPLPWGQRQLLRLFPSFKDAVQDRGPMSIAQRDAVGLLSSRTASRAVGSLPVTEEVPQQQQLQQLPQKQQPQQQQPPPTQQQQGPASPMRTQQPQQQQQPEAAAVAGQYGRSPDSDDCAEPTGRHLMQQFHEQRGVSSPLPVSPPAAAGSKLAGSSGGRQAADVRVAAGSPPRTAAPAAAKTAAASERSGGGGGCDSAAASPRSREHRHTTEHADAAYTLPEHAQVAALLGQPVYDLSLSAGPGSPAASGSKARRSPFAGELVHHSHPPGPQLTMARSSSHPQAVPASPRAPPAVLAEALAQMPCLSRVSVSSSIGHWLSDDEEEEEERDECLTKQQQQQLEGESGVEPGSGTLRSHSSPSAAVFSSLPFSVRNDPLLRVIPKYYGVREHGDGRILLELEDLARAYRHPCIMDIKVGFRTWYPQADTAYIQRCREKDTSTTQAALGFKICGMQVFRHGAGGYWRASKRWCKTLPAELVDKALFSFAHNNHGLRPAAVYGGAAGAIAQLEALEAWFAVQRDFHFYSSSVLLLYEGDAASAEEAKVRVRMVDFAHTFQCERPARDANFLAGLRALLARLRGVVHAQLQQELVG